MKIEYYFLIPLSLGYLCHIRAECCYSVDVTFLIKNKSKQCSDYGATLTLCSYLHNVCGINVCGDGLPLVVSGNWFCGVGDCNVFGCNCDFGCVKGNPYENFQKIQGDEILVLN